MGSTSTPPIKAKSGQTNPTDAHGAIAPGPIRRAFDSLLANGLPQETEPVERASSAPARAAAIPTTPSAQLAHSPVMSV